MTIQFFCSKSMKNLAMRFQHFSPRVQTSRLLVLNLIIILGGCEAAAQADTWARLNERAKQSFENGQYVDAERLYLAAVNESEKPGNDPSRRIQSLVQLASVCRRQNRPAQALPFSRQGVDLGEQLPSPGNPEALTSALNDLAETYLNLGRLADGELFVCKALNEGKSHLGPDHLEIARSLSLQACLYSARRNFSDAENACLHALRIREKRLGAEHPLVARSLGQWGGILRDQGKLCEAERVHRHALQIMEKFSVGRQDLMLGNLNELALTCLARKRFGEAERLFQRMIQIHQGVSSCNSAEMTIAMVNLAGVLQCRGRFDQAETLYRQGIPLMETDWGSDHPECGIGYANLARLQFRLRRYAEAELSFQHSLAILEKNLRPDYPDLGFILKGYARLLYKLNRKTEAATIKARANQIVANRRAITNQTVHLDELEMQKKGY